MLQYIIILFALTITLSTYLPPPTSNVLTLEPVRNVAHIVKVYWLIGKDTIQVFFIKSVWNMTIDSESFFNRLANELSRYLNINDLRPLLLS